MITLLAIGLCGLAVGAAGAVRQVLPREFSVAQQQQIQNWEMTRRWRAQQAGQIFPATLPYRVPGSYLNGSDSLALTARRLGIATPSSCGTAVSKSAAAVLAAGRCAAVLRATYLDASESMVATVGVAALSNRAAAMAAVAKLGASVHNQSFAVHAFPLARSAGHFASAAAPAAGHSNSHVGCGPTSSSRRRDSPMAGGTCRYLPTTTSSGRWTVSSPGWFRI